MTVAVMADHVTVARSTKFEGLPTGVVVFASIEVEGLVAKVVAGWWQRMEGWVVLTIS